MGMTYFSGGSTRGISFSFHGATFGSNSRPGIANTVHTMKNQNHPVWATIYPVAALAKVRGTEARLVKSATVSVTDSAGTQSSTLTGTAN